MGLMTGSGCLSRVLGPVFVTYIYTEFGTIVTFAFTTVMMAACLVWLLYFSRRLIPQEIVQMNEEEGEELHNISNFESVELDDAEHHNETDTRKV